MEPDKVVEKWTKEWADGPKKSVEELMKKHGPPTDGSSNMLIWQDKAPWKEIRVKNEEVKHDFPEEHKESCIFVIEQKVPPEKVGEIAKLNGSMMVDTTKGQTELRAENEQMAMLELNAANELIQGKDIEEVKSSLKEDAQKAKKGKQVEKAQKLMLKKQQHKQEEQPDTKQLKEQVEEIGDKIVELGEEIKKSAKT
jgi:hypothetical protein